MSVSQNADRSEVIDAIHSYFGCGTVRPDPSDATVKWESRSLGDLVERVLPHFRMWPLLSGKRQDVVNLDVVCQAMTRREHLEPGHGLRRR